MSLTWWIRCHSFYFWILLNSVLFQIQKGASSARSDDTKSLKGAVLDWIAPRGQPLSPPLARNVKVDRGFHHEHTGALLCPAGLDWSNNEWVFSRFQVNPLTQPRVKEKLRTGEMMVPGDQWPIFLYHGFAYDPEDPWNGLFRSTILISVSLPIPIFCTRTDFNVVGFQTYFHFSEFCRKRAESYSFG